MKSRFTLSIIQALCWTLLLAGCNPEDPKIENLCEIRYTTNDGRPIDFNTLVWEREPFYHAYKDNTGVIVFDVPITSIRYRAFYNCTNLKTITIPESVTWIGDSAFEKCSGLTNITIPESVPEIGESAFYGCTSLTDVTIPDSVTAIGDYAFYDCIGLTNITIPDSVMEIGFNVFYECFGLKNVYCKPTIPPHGNANMFGINASGRKIYVPSGSVEAYKTAPYWSDYAGDIVGYDF